MTNLSGTRVPGYRGIWFTLGQPLPYGDKYSGGLGTYTANHLPMAVYAREVNKTFFVYGGTTDAQDRRLLCMASEYDHAQHRVPRPVVVHDKQTVNDPHDNPAINIDDDGHLWVFVSGRGQKRPGFKYRSVNAFDVSKFELIEEREMTYPQIHRRAASQGGGFVHLLTKYTAGRELYWQTSRDGRQWDADRMLAGFGGHYQVSAVAGETIGSAFMFHPGGNVDRRTNLYYVQSRDGGRSFTTIDEKPLDLPLKQIQNPALVIDYQAQKLNVYIHDLQFDAHGHPVILYLTSRSFEPGPESGPHTWRLTKWTGTEWRTTDVATSDHCYDTGCLHLSEKPWRIIGPTAPGPQPWATGGEMALLLSDDAGVTWRHDRWLTKDSRYNHSYARSPLNAADPFFALWADGHPHEISPSHLYFADSEGQRVYQLPYEMNGDFAEPKDVTPR